VVLARNSWAWSGDDRFQRNPIQLLIIHLLWA
jgi:hypothetical protein